MGKTPAITFAKDGLWIYDGKHKPYRWNASVRMFFSIMVYNKELDIENLVIRVRGDWSGI